MNNLKLEIIIIPIILFLIDCSASTGSRYEETNGNDNNKISLNEDFDISKYKTKIDIEPISNNEGVSDIWYEYEDDSNQTSYVRNQKIVGTIDGYRVLVVATDNMDNANSVREDILDKTKRQEVYISFEPPFYKVKIGDFADLKEANNLEFKLNQLGYTEARVVQETVNIYEE